MGGRVCITVPGHGHGEGHKDDDDGDGGGGHDDNCINAIPCFNFLFDFWHSKSLIVK